jgi:hypothetical protein
MSTELVSDARESLATGAATPPTLFIEEVRVAERFWDFFTANIYNKHTRRAYCNAVCKFSEFCAERGVHDLAYEKPVYISAYIESLQHGFAKTHDQAAPRGNPHAL